MKIKKHAYGVKSLPKIIVLCFLALLRITCVSAFLVKEMDNVSGSLLFFVLFFFCFLF